MKESSILSIDIENSRSNNGIYCSTTEQPVTYQELELHISCFINLIKEKYPNVKRIALFMNQSVDYMLCFLAIYRAGLVPMPVSPDPDNPSERIISLIEGAGIDLVITTSTYGQHSIFRQKADEEKSKLSNYPEICFIDVEKSKFSNFPEMIPDNISINDNDVGYIVNTSGSTGKPKQVILARSGLSYCIKGLIDSLGINSHDNIAAFADVAFDAHISEMYMAKESGANLFIVPIDCRRDFTKLPKFYQTHKITVGVFVASMLRRCEPKDFPDLRVVICTGEKIDDEIIRKWGNRCLLVDGYGPAENTIATWLKLIRFDNDKKKVEMRIIPGTKCYILEKSGNTPVEQGKEGELCLAGPGIALGYTDPELTKERFLTIPDPDHYEKEIRIYRTRDLVRQNNDGSIDIVGRLDRQIKVYGKLVYPEEIEEVIKNIKKKISNVSAIYVDAKINDQGHPDFIAYIELYDKEKSIDLSDLYEKIKLKLGQTFIPNRWVVVDKLPQAKSSQKTTIEGLELNKSVVRRLQGHSRQVPKSEVEKEIAELFLSVLQIPEKDFTFFRDDNFFELGGQSLQATLLIQILRAKYKLRLSYEQFVRNATVEQLSRNILRVRNKTEKKEIITLYEERQALGNAPVFLIHSLLGNAENDYDKLKTVWNAKRSLYAISARGLKDPEDMDNDLLVIAYDYYLAIKNICPRGPKIIAGWSLGGILAVLIKYFFDMDHHQSVKIVMVDSESPTIFQSMSPFEYAKYLHDLFEKKLMGQFSLKTLPLSIEDLSVLPKAQQIYKLFQAVASSLSGLGTEENKHLLFIVQNLLLGILKLRLNTIISDLHLIAASETQKRRKDKNLCWPSNLVEIKSIETFTGDHDSIILVPNNAKLIANSLDKVTTEFQQYFMVNLLSTELQLMPIADIGESEFCYYIPAKGCRNNNYENSFGILEFIKDSYLKNKQNVLLILGNPVIGKTMFVQSLVKYLNQNVNHIVTLYIPVALYKNPTQGLINSHLVRLGLSDVQISHLKKHQKFIFILDGYDEIEKGKYQNLYATNHLDQWNAQIIITCKSSYLYNIQDYRLLFCPIKKSNPDYSGLDVISIVPFENSQIENYIAKFLNNLPEEVIIDKKWQKVQMYLDHIDQLPEIRELVRTPFLLYILIKVLPKIVSSCKDAPFEKRIALIQSKILDAFVENLWQRHLVKLMLYGQLPKDDHNITHHFEEFQKFVRTLLGKTSGEKFNHLQETPQSSSSTIDPRTLYNSANMHCFDFTHSAITNETNSVNLNYLDSKTKDSVIPDLSIDNTDIHQSQPSIANKLIMKGNAKREDISNNVYELTGLSGVPIKQLAKTISEITSAPQNNNSSTGPVFKKIIMKDNTVAMTAKNKISFDFSNHAQIEKKPDKKEKKSSITMDY